MYPIISLTIFKDITGGEIESNVVAICDVTGTAWYYWQYWEED